MSKELIQLDKRFPDCTAIDTEEWLARVLGDEVMAGGSLEKAMQGKWLKQCDDLILDAIQNHEERAYTCTSVDNVYNNENDFSSVFQWQVFYPRDTRSDWFYADDVYVAIEVHEGGDMRCNYGRVRLYRVDSLVDSGFLDWVLGWQVNYANGEPVPENDRFCIGYASHPFYEMREHLKTDLRWSEKRNCFVGVYQDGRCVEAHPYLYVN